MELIEKTIEKDIGIHSQFIDKKICFLDIETTGFNRNTDTIYLIGIVYFDNSFKNWRSIQYFAEELTDEVDILLQAHKILSEVDRIINYNGTSFDIPFINNKLKYYRTNLSIDLNKSFDLYRILQSNKNILQLKNYRLESIEKYLGIQRENKFTGKECIDFYFDYLVTKNPVTKENILLHNYEDLYYLLDVIDLLNILEVKKTITIHYNNNDNHLLIDQIQLRKDYLLIKGSISNNNIGNIVYFTDHYKIILTKENTFEVSLEVMEGMVTPTEKCRFIKARDFHLPKESSYWSNQFKVPRGIILLSVEKNYYIENIKEIIKKLIHHILKV